MLMGVANTSWVKSALIVGHSIVFWAARYAAGSGWGSDFGLEDLLQLCWAGRGHMR